MIFLKETMTFIPSSSFDTQGSPMMQPKLVFWSKFIQLAAVLMLGLSAILLLAPILGESLFNMVYFYQFEYPSEIDETAISYIRFANGVLGAVMAGWMVGIIMIARGPLLKGDEYAWNTIAVPLALWFFLDSAFSISYGSWGNVILNVSTALIFSVPLIAIRPYLNR